MNESQTLAHELNHRVKNNFQIIVSLMNLKMRMLPPDRRDDIRFLQEHVQCMAIAYRLVYDTGDMSQVLVSDLLNEIVGGLRVLARLNVKQLILVVGSDTDHIGLDQAISFGLYLSVVLPPYLDMARHEHGVVTIDMSIRDRNLTLSIRGDWREAVVQDFLRSRLAAAYTSRLGAQILAPLDPSELRISFLLDDRPMSVASEMPLDLVPLDN